MSPTPDGAFQDVPPPRSGGKEILRRMVSEARSFFLGALPR